MNPKIVERIIEDWKLAAPPAKPGPDRIERYRQLLPRRADWSALVLGTTPEILDVLLTSGAKRLVAMDIHSETMTAMRHFARQDWRDVEMIIGDWCVPQTGFAGGFDVIISDGGPLFLPFPDTWRTLFEVLYSYLVPGGRILIGHFSVPEPQPDSWACYKEIINRFNEDSRLLLPEAHESLFKSAVAAARVASFYGAVDPGGRVMTDRAAANMKPVLDDLISRFPLGPLHRVLQAMFFRPNPIGQEGAGMVAMPGFSLIRPLLESLGFTEVGMQVLHERPEPGIAMIIEGSRPNQV